MFWLAFVAVFVTRLPFLGLGYGLSPDGWHIAANAHRIATDGLYSSSQGGGHPVHEIGTALMFGGNIWAVTLSSALATALSVGALALMLWRIRGEQAALLATAVGFVPVVFIASTGGSDHPWTLAALMLSTWLALEDRPILAGVFMGLAIGCRLSVLPLGLVPLLLILGRRQSDRGGHVLRLLFTGGLVAAIAYLPVVLTYGWSGAPSVRMLPTFEGAPTAVVLRRGFVDVWGLVGLLGVGFALLSAFASRRPPPIFSARTELARPSWRWTAWLLGVLIPAALFAQHPAHAGVLVPAIPFVFLLAAERLKPRIARIFAAMVILSPFILHVRPSTTAVPVAPTWSVQVGSARLEPFRGPLLFDRAMRQARQRVARQVIDRLPQLDPGTNVVVGPWQPMLSVLGSPRALDRVRLRYTLAPADLTATSTQTRFYVLPGVLRDDPANPQLRGRTLPLPAVGP